MRYTKGMLGKHHSKETKEKLRNFMKGRHHSPKTEFKKGQCGKKAGHWKGGKRKHTEGYFEIKMLNHPLANNSKYVLEHRLVMEKHLGRYLFPCERVHHINGIRTDNRIKNLKLFSNDSTHQKYHHKCTKKKTIRRVS